MLSTTTTLIGLFELSAKTLEIAWIFWASEKPTILSGVISLMNGNSDACAMVAARAVLPVPGGPCNRRLTSGVRVDVRTCSTKSLPERSNSCKKKNGGRSETEEGACVEKDKTHVDHDIVVYNTVLHDLC